MTRSLSVSSRVSTLALAAALAVGPSPAAAQSFQGTGSFAHGSGNIATPDSITTNITIDTPQAVIDWTPDADGGTSGQDIVFQAGGTFATFSSATDFAVLNRIDVDDMTRMVRMDGTISSLVNQSTGGSVYFYSPSGIVLGATSVINVGSLVLTSLPVTVDGNGNFINNGLVEFGSAPDPFGNSVNFAARIETHPLSTISALTAGSYVAMVAPRVQHHGTINVDGSAALVGAEAATITFRPSGLFDIQFDVGTTDPNGVAVYGDITGPAAGVGETQRIYLAAVPKNSAMTMLISQGADLGFDVAGFADVDGNAVVLSAGHDVHSSADFDESSASGAAANANIFNTNFTSAFSGTASGNIDVTAAAAGTTHFASNASLRSSGGYVQVESLGANSVLGVDGDLSVVTDRFGDTDGESVTAGQAAIYAQSGGTLSVDGNVNVSANGYGGDSFLTGVSAGNGTGGQVLIQAEAGSSLFIGGNMFVTSDGYGGQPGAAGVNAGNGSGGSIFIGTIGSNALFGMNGTTFASASGYGGAGDGSGNECFNCDGLGGTGTGGFIDLGTTTGTGSSAFYGNLVELYADGTGGRSAQPGSAAGTGFGGSVDVFAAGGSQVEGYGLTFASNLIASAIGMGGESQTPGITAGLGDGGIVQIFATANSTMGIFGGLDVDADGVGGFNDSSVNGGDGVGGQVNMSVDGGNAFINVAGTADLEADGEGSFANSDCIGCGGIGGDGFGGTVQVYGGGGTNNSINFSNALGLSAEGYGGIGATGIAGIGDGGQATVNASPGLSLFVGTTLTIEADGYGGYGYNGNGGGDGIGGTAAIYGSGGSLDVFGNTFLDAGGVGGSTGIVAGGIGGDGTGGIAQIYASAGTLDFVGSLFVEAVGEGGNSVNGTGGNAVGGRVTVSGDGGDIHVFTNLFLDGSAAGGDGNVGGNATALVSNVEDESDPIAAAIYARNDGTVDVDGIASINGEAIGGDGANGNGGNASGGEIDVVAFFGDITLGALSVGVVGTGGNGGNGGNGGSGLGGAADITFGLGAAAVGGTINLGSAFILADGFGGAGGAGVDGTVGGNGGLGGDGTGGRVSFAGTAAGGMLISGAANINVRGEGGDGGAGGTGSTGTGGAGGAGGVGRGGFVQTGTLSADLSPTTGGGATYTTLSVDSSAFGGTGGDGGTGATINGVGGDGGDAFGGRSTFLVRGVLVTADTVSLFASALGGNGGTGSTQGNGGDATTGTIAVESKDRFNHPTQRGNLIANSIIGSALAVAGTGGTTTVTDGSSFRVLNGDATIGSVTITLSGTEINSVGGPSRVSVRDGLADIDSFNFTTTGQLTLDAGKQAVGGLFDGRMVSDSITLSADTFVPDTDPAPAVRGSYQAGTFDISTDGNFVTNANLISGSDLVIDAPGNIVAANINAVGPVDLFAGVNATTGNITSGDSISVVADTGGIVGGVMNSGGSILLDGATGVSTGVLGNLTAAGGIQVLSGGSIVTGITTSNGGNISMDGDGSVSVESVNAFGSATLLAGTNFNTGNINAGGPVAITAQTGTMDIGNLVAGGDVSLTAGDTILAEDVTTPGSITASAGTGNLRLEILQSGGDVDLSAGGNVTTGNVDAAGGISAATTSGNLDLADLNAGTNVLLDSGASMSLGNVVAQTGSVQASAVDVLSFASITAGTFVTIDPADIIGGDITALAGDVTATGDSIDIGNVTASDNIFLTALAGDLSTLAISAGIDVTLDATGAITTGNISAFGTVDASGSLLDLGNVNASTLNFFSSAGSIATGDLVAFTSLTVDSADDFLFGSIIAPLVDLDAPGSIIGGYIDSDGDITAVAGVDIDVGDLSAGGVTIEGFFQGNVDLTAGGGINTGVIDAFGSVLADAGAGISTGAIDALTFVQLLGGGNIFTGAINAGGFIDIFTTGGDISTGDLTGTNINLEAETGDIEFANVDADLFDFDAGGTADGGNIVATSAATGSANGAVVLGNITVGPGLPPVDEFSVGFSSATSITVGHVSGADKVGFATFGNLVTGDLQAGSLIMTLVGGDITVGSMTTTQPFGQVYMADSQMYVDAGGLDDNFDLDLVLNANAIPTGGSVTINGPVDTGLLSIAAGGLISFNGDVTADGSNLMSGDLALASGVTVSGFTSLYSINGQGTFIGDGLTGPGYMLSNAEYNAFQNVSMEVRPDLGAAALLTMGDLNINSSITEADFAIEDFDDNDLGTIRVVGDVRMNNATGELFFESETFQLDAATGSIVISADGTTPGGELIIAANNIHVAEGAILDQLAANPQYDGYQDDLNAPASVQRPDGVIRANTVTLEFGDTPADLYTLYVQNMGSEETPAAFVITDLNLGDDGEGTLPAGSLDLVINGQIITGNGTLIGIAVRDLLVQGRDLTPFTSNSTINGCLLVGACAEAPPPPPPPPPPTPLDRPDFQPSPGIQQEIVLAKDNLLPPPEFGNEDFIDDNDEETDEGSTSPIEPPDPLFDTSELGEEAAEGGPVVGTSMRSNPGLTQPGDVDDPVSGSGNPALMETPADPPSKEEKQQ